MYYVYRNGQIEEVDRPDSPVENPVPTESNNLVDYSEEFNTPSNKWIVNHNLGRYPLVLVMGEGGIEIEAEVIHVSINQLQALFSSPHTGRIRCI